MAFKLFRKNSDDEAVRRSDDELNGAGRKEDESPRADVRSLPDRPELPTTNGLPEIVSLMESYRVATLQLNQQGNEMTAVMDPSEKPERKTTVDTQSNWFDPVAKLYTAAQASEDGPWRRAEIMISSVRDGKRSVEVEYSYPNSEEQTRKAYTQTVPTTLAGGGKAEAASSEQKSTESEGDGKAAATGAVAGGAAGATAASATKSASKTEKPADKDQSDALGAVADDADARKSETPKDTTSPEVLGTPDEAGSTAASATDEPVNATDAPEQTAKGSTPTAPEGTTSSSFSEASAQGNKSSEKPASGAAVGGAAVGGAAVGGAAATAAASDKDAKPASADASVEGTNQPEDHEQGASEPVPAVVDDPQWDGEDNRREAGTSSAVAADLPDSVPSTADQTDVAPSYSTSGPNAPQKPSTTQLAPGNLVLTEADVLQRIGEAQTTLFGANGTARDVSTVLIRVRALGSYYDALTHVRRNGFWDQRKTFDLIPEEALHILELKSDSYQEGFGSPVAMMFRFTPGVPPQVSFSYEDEESFVKYKDRLPAQQYIEELRMFPRTGANIPEHMTDALTQWTL